MVSVAHGSYGEDIWGQLLADSITLTIFCVFLRALSKLLNLFEATKAHKQSPNDESLFSVTYSLIPKTSETICLQSGDLLPPPKTNASFESGNPALFRYE